MQEIILKLEPRNIVGKQVKSLRQSGMVPAVIHDHGKESIVVMAPYIEIFKTYQKAGKNHPVSLRADSKRFTALIKQTDFDPKKHTLRHIVFNAVDANETVDAEVPVRIKLPEGDESTPAEKAGLVVLHQLEEVEVEALPKDLPEALYFDGQKLVAVGDHATVADLVIPAGVKVKTDLGHPVATVFEPSALQAANDAAGGTAEEEVQAEETETSEGEATPTNGDAKESSKNEKDK